MNTVFKTVLFFGISTVGLYCCARIVTNGADDDAGQPAEWEPMTSTQAESAEFRPPERPASSDKQWLPLDDSFEFPSQATSRTETEDRSFSPDKPFGSRKHATALPAVESEAETFGLPDGFAGKVSNPFVPESARQEEYATTSLPAIRSKTTLGDGADAMGIVQNQFKDRIDIPDDTEFVDHSPLIQSIQGQYAGESKVIASVNETPEFSVEPTISLTNVSDATSESESDFEVSSEVQLDVESQADPEISAQTNIASVLDPSRDRRLAAESPDSHDPQTEGHLAILQASPIVEERALEHINYGKSLARRGAVFAARQEFLQAVRMIVESHDMSSSSRSYTGKLAAAMRALSESDDFFVVDSEQQMELDLRSILQTHTTRLINPASTGNLSPIQAMQTYYAFASEQMMQAVGQSQVAGEALYALGKLMTTSARSNASGKPLDSTKAMVMHQVALSADPSNHRSANELGVLFANNGRWYQAMDLFSHSLRAKQTAATWKNLATAHEQIARRSNNPQEQQSQTELATLALKEFEMLSTGATEIDAILPSTWASSQDFSDLAAMPEMQGESYAPESVPVEVADQPGPKGLLRNVKDWF